MKVVEKNPQSRQQELESELARHIDRFAGASLINQAAALIAFLEKKGFPVPEPLTHDRRNMEDVLARQLTRINHYHTSQERAAAIIAVLKN